MKFVTMLLAVVLLAGCRTNPVVPEVKVVKINRPVPYSPAPPAVPQCTNYTAALTPADSKDPGKVAQAYVLDLTCYRANDLTFRQILQHYNAISDQTQTVQQMIDAVGTQYDSALGQQPVKP